MKYLLCILAVLVSTTLLNTEALKKPDETSIKYEGDFEFVDEVSKGKWWTYLLRRLWNTKSQEIRAKQKIFSRENLISFLLLSGMEKLFIFCKLQSFLCFIRFAYLLSDLLFRINRRRLLASTAIDLLIRLTFFFQGESSKQLRKALISERKKWIHDPSSEIFSFIFSIQLFILVNVFLDDLCKPLNCKKKELCLLEDAYTAVCVSKKGLHKNK